MRGPIWMAIKTSEKTVSEVAKELGICRVTLYNKLSGRTDFKQCELVKLAEFLNVPVESLFERGDGK